MIYMNCPNCTELITADAWFTGQIVACGSCGFKAQFPAVTTPPIITPGGLVDPAGEIPELTYATPLLYATKRPEGSSPEVAPLLYATMRSKYSSLALASLLCGIVALVGFMFGMGLVLGPLAIVLGSKAARTQKAFPGEYSGKGLATAGSMLGWGSIAVTIAAAICWLSMHYGLV